MDCEVLVQWTNSNVEDNTWVDVKDLDLQVQHRSFDV